MLQTLHVSYKNITYADNVPFAVKQTKLRGEKYSASFSLHIALCMY